MPTSWAASSRKLTSALIYKKISIDSLIHTENALERVNSMSSLKIESGELAPLLVNSE